MVRNEEIQTNILVSAIELDNFEKDNGSNWGCELRLTLGFCACGNFTASFRQQTSTKNLGGYAWEAASKHRPGHDLKNQQNLDQIFTS